MRARRHHRRVEDVCRCVAGRSARATHHVDGFLAHERPPALPRVQHAARCDGIQRQPAGSGRGEVAVDINEEFVLLPWA